jgi:hypothetical protein
MRYFDSILINTIIEDEGGDGVNKPSSYSYAF